MASGKEKMASARVARMVVDRKSVTRRSALVGTYTFKDASTVWATRETLAK